MTSAAETAFLGIGANAGDAAATVVLATDIIDRLEGVTLRTASALYQTDPWGDANQAVFVNRVIMVSTILSPEHLLARLHDIEDRLGRQRDPIRRWGPRRIDLDLLAQGRHQRQTASIVLPHPRLHQRRFVLQPWAEIAPEYEVPGLTTVTRLLADCTDRGNVSILIPATPESNRAPSA